MAGAVMNADPCGCPGPQAISNEHAARVRDVIFRVHGEWFERWVSQEREGLDQAVVAAGLREKLPHFRSGGSFAIGASHKPFEVFVLGSVKFGKSTLINALLGIDVAPTDMMPKTWCFNRYVATESPVDHVRVFVDERHVTTDKDLRDLLGAPTGQADGLRTHQLTQRQAASLMEMEERKTEDSLNTANPYVSPVLEMEWQVPTTNAVLKGIRLVDTMGINGIREKKGHLHRLSWEFARADAVIWVISALNLNDASMRSEMNNFRRFAKRSVLVVNRWDEVSDTAKLANRARELYGSMVNDIVFLSALAASVGITRRVIGDVEPSKRIALTQFMERKKARNHDDLLIASGFPRLREVLEQKLETNLAAIRNEAAYNRLRVQQTEFRKMARTALDDHHSNLARYNKLTKMLDDARRETKELVESRSGQLLEEMVSRIDRDLGFLTYADCEHPERKVDLQAIENLCRAEQQRIAERIEHAFASLYATSDGPDEDYRESEFAADGDVAELLQSSSLGAIKIEVARVKLDAVLPRGERGWGVRFLDFVANIPFIGGFLDNLFGGAEKRDRAVREMRSAIRGSVMPKLSDIAKLVATALRDESRRVAESVSRDIEEHSARLGSVAEQESRIVRLEQFLNTPAPAPVWAELTTAKLRSLRWTKA